MTETATAQTPSRANVTDTVLVVDDNADVSASLRALLEIGGKRVAVAANGREAMAALDGPEPICIVLLDLMMPVMSGWEFLDHLRREPRHAGLPVIVCSAYHENAPVEQVQHVLPKPVSLEVLMAQITRFCPH